MDYYNHISKGYEELYREEQEEKWEVLKDYVDVRGKKVLEVGCGTGIITEKLQEAKELTAVDKSRKMIEVAREKGINAKFLVADATKLPFKDDEFDLVISVTMLQDLEDPLKAIEEMRRVGRKVIFTCLAKGERVKLIREKYGKGIPCGKDELWIIFKNRGHFSEEHEKGRGHQTNQGRGRAGQEDGGIWGFRRKESWGWC